MLKRIMTEHKNEVKTACNVGVHAMTHLLTGVKPYLKRI